MPSWTIKIEPSENGEPRVLLEAQDAEAEQAAKIAYLRLRSAALSDDVADRIIVRLALIDGRPMDAVLTLKELAELLSDSTLTLNRAARRI